VIDLHQEICVSKPLRFLKSRDLLEFPIVSFPGEDLRGNGGKAKGDQTKWELNPKVEVQSV
jgi:hypothetical protein